jgi:CRISPR-associated protein Csx17
VSSATPHARGRWTPAGFELTTSLTEDELIDFFVRDYAPTPIVAPWNGGSGYYAKDNQEGIGPIEASDHPPLRALPARDRGWAGSGGQVQVRGAAGW